MSERSVAIILAGGQGRRMNSIIPKQYLLIDERPVLYYSLKIFEESFINEIILVTAEEEIDYCRENIVNRYGFGKVKRIVAGGKERYLSVANGISAVEHADYLYIHDGARPFVDKEILNRTREAASKYGACAAGMPVKDTIKIADENGFAERTPNRSMVWAIQTPQVFAFELIRDAYERLLDKEQELLEAGVQITDDSMVVETLADCPVKLVPGSYRNIKITTPEDLKIAHIFMKQNL